MWPCASTCGRREVHVQRLGLSMKLLRFGAQVAVKVKRWHRRTSNPFRSMQLLGPSPFMSTGWHHGKDENNVMHVRTAIDPDGDEHSSFVK